MKASREPKLPGLPPEPDPAEDADTGVVELPWEDAASSGADPFAEREQQAVAALGKKSEISTTLRGAPDTIKLGAQTWNPPAGKAPGRAATPDTVKLSAQTRRPPTDADDDFEEVTDVDPNAISPARRPVVTGEGDAEVAGVIRADEGPARIVNHPPDPAASVSGEIPASIEVSPSAAVPRRARHNDSLLETTPLPRYQREATPPPGFREATPVPAAYSPPRRDATMLVDARSSGASTPAIIAVALISALLGLGAGWLLWAPASPTAAAQESQVAAASPGDSKPGVDETPAPAVAPTPATCKLAVHSKPEGAEVRAGDAQLGVTPFDAEVECRDEIELRINLRHYTPVTRTVKLSPDGPVKVAVDLERPTYKLTVRSVPRGATVAINGEDRGKTPTVVDVPGHEELEVEISRRGYRTYKESVTAKRRRTLVKTKLRRKR